MGTVLSKAKENSQLHPQLEMKVKEAINCMEMLFFIFYSFSNQKSTTSIHSICMKFCMQAYFNLIKKKYDEEKWATVLSA